MKRKKKRRKRRVVGPRGSLEVINCTVGIKIIVTN